MDIYKLLSRLKWYRKREKGHWVKTKHRGWITIETFKLYIGYRFDPIFIREEIYK